MNYNHIRTLHTVQEYKSLFVNNANKDYISQVLPGAHVLLLFSNLVCLEPSKRKNNVPLVSLKKLKGPSLLELAFSTDQLNFSVAVFKQAL